MLTDMDINFSGRSEIIMIKHGSANVKKGPKLCMDKLPTERLSKFFQQ